MYNLGIYLYLIGVAIVSCFSEKVRKMWCGERECEDAIKEETGGATTRCMPFEQKELSHVCVHCGKPAKQMMYFGKAY